MSLGGWVSGLALLLPGVLFGQATVKGRPAITGISHVSFYADDVGATREFYTSLVGWEPVPATEARPGQRLYANHLQYVELLAPPQIGQPNRLDHIAFSTANAEALRKYLGKNGVEVPAAVDMAEDGSRNLIVRDLEGNKVEFTQEGKRTPAEPADADDRLSGHLMHAGYVVRDRALADQFYKDLLGFHLYWQGGSKPEQTDWVMMQVPNGTDWVEYMLYVPADATRGQLAGANHIAPGVVSVVELQAKLEKRGWAATGTKDPKSLGVDGKWQLDLFDPDGTRVEFMEFAPVATPCCSAYTGPQPSASSAW